MEDEITKRWKYIQKYFLVCKILVECLQLEIEVRSKYKDCVHI